MKAKKIIICILAFCVLSVASADGKKKASEFAYSGSDDIDSVAWYEKNSGDRTREVMTKAPNSLGLYDMSGNVCEWCWDLYKGKYYEESPEKNPRGADSGDCRVARGGSYIDRAIFCNSIFRRASTDTGFGTDFGFRVVRNATKDTTVANDFVFVQGGSFVMGSDEILEDETLGKRGLINEYYFPAHKVSVDSFYMCIHEVTQEEYAQFYANTSEFKEGGSYPVETVNWYDAVFYCNARSRDEGLSPCYYVIDDSDLHRRVDIYTMHDVYFGEGGKDAEIHCDWNADGYRLPLNGNMPQEVEPNESKEN